MKNYYTILEITSSADLTAVKKAYRKLAIQYHPDKNSSPEASRLFIEVTEAYEVLRNPQSRKEYDTLLAANFRNSTTTITMQQQQQSWQEYGRQKANEYSSMHIDDFILRVIDEVKIGVRYGINFALIGFCVFAVISTPTFFSIDPFLGIFCLVLYGGLGYLLFNRTKQDYQKDRKQKFNN